MQEGEGEIKEECKDSDEEFWENLEESEEVEFKGIRPKPSQEEVDRHMATHLPFRSWCEFCVRGKAKNAVHKFKKITYDG